MGYLEQREAMGCDWWDDASYITAQGDPFAHLDDEEDDDDTQD